MSTEILIADPLTPSSARVRYVSEGKRVDSQRESHPRDAAHELADGPDDADGAGQGRGQAAAPTTTQAVVATRPSLFSDYIQLTKPRIVTMILVTTVASAMIAAGGWIATLDMLWLLMGTAMVAGSAGAANQIWERRIDCNMTRTASRPLPAERVKLLPAILYTAALVVIGTAILVWQFGYAPALAGVATWLLYVLVYTPMKTRTAWNTTVGAVAGALPVLMGYTAAGGGIEDWTGWLLVAVLAAWQYPHFMAIAWLYRRQYGEAGFCMSTTVDPSGRSAGAQSIAGSIAILGCSVALCVIPGGSIPAMIIASVAAIFACYPMLRASIRFSATPDDVMARKLLRSSLLVLPAVLAIVTVRTVL
ncbi:heme o synthase [Novipirellula rosea]|uniref:Protoheme IX farnesyltransferase n=1 Tax=Novipirellula rosea TaxID=1031540 RepID=A0ABP8MI20_9BACT